MSILSFPTSKDIYIEANGKVVALVQGYKAKSTRKTHNIEAFGQSESVASLVTSVTHIIEISKLYIISSENEDHDFYEMTDFNMVIVKPDRKIIFEGCNWADITEACEVSSTVLQKVTIVAKKRMVYYD